MDKTMKLSFLPPETLELILENTNGLEFLLLWMCGDKALCERLSRCQSIAIEWDGSKACSWPSFLIQSLRNLLSFSLSHSQYITHAKVENFQLELLPKTLEVLKLSFRSKQALSNTLDKLFPNLIRLDLMYLNLKLKEPVCLPPTLQILEIMASNTSEYITFQKLLSNLPLLNHLKVLGELNTDASPIVWPECLEYCEVTLLIRLSADTPMAFYFSQTLPSSLKHLKLHLMGRISNRDHQIEQFPWGSLPASLLSITCAGIVNPPSLFPPKLEHFTLHYGELSIDKKASSTLFLELLRKAPPTLKSFTILSIFKRPLRIEYEDLDAGRIPPSLERIEIASIPLFTRLPRLTPSITSLLLEEAYQGVVEDKSIVLPETLTSLTFEKSSGPYPLCWSLPRGMKTLKLSKYPYDPSKGASGLPPNLTELECCSAAFPESSHLPDIPASITRLSLLVVDIYSFMPIKSGECRAFCDIMKASTAKHLPKNLKILHIAGEPHGNSTITTWFSELDPKLPLTDLHLEGVELALCEALLNLPPTLRILASNISQYSGKHFHTLPRKLRILHLYSTDSHYLDTKLEHLNHLPPGIVDIIISSNHSITSEDVQRVLPLAKSILLNQ